MEEREPNRDGHKEESGNSTEDMFATEEIQIEEVSIDGICGVY